MTDSLVVFSALLIASFLGVAFVFYIAMKMGLLPGVKFGDKND